jgi:hypothetical protein
MIATPNKGWSNYHNTHVKTKSYKTCYKCAVGEDIMVKATHSQDGNFVCDKHFKNRK